MCLYRFSIFNVLYVSLDFFVLVLLFLLSARAFGQ